MGKDRGVMGSPTEAESWFAWLTLGRKTHKVRGQPSVPHAPRLALTLGWCDKGPVQGRLRAEPCIVAGCAQGPFPASPRTPLPMTQAPGRHKVVGEWAVALS